MAILIREDTINMMYVKFLFKKDIVMALFLSCTILMVSTGP